MSSPKSSASVPPQVYPQYSTSDVRQTLIEGSRVGQQNYGGFSGHLQREDSLNLNYSMQSNPMPENYAAHQNNFSVNRNLMTENMLIYYQASPLQTIQLNQEFPLQASPLQTIQLNQEFPLQASPLQTIHLNHEFPLQHMQFNQEFVDPTSQQPLMHPQLQLRAPQRLELQRVGGEEILHVEPERPLFAVGKPRLRWTPELHARFVRAVFELGGLEFATPKRILVNMKVTGVTIDHIKSHLQKVRTRYPNGIPVTDPMHPGIQNNVDMHPAQIPVPGQGLPTSGSVAHRNGNGFNQFKADFREYGTLPKSYESPNFNQNLGIGPSSSNASGQNLGIGPSSSNASGSNLDGLRSSC